MQKSKPMSEAQVEINTKLAQKTAKLYINRYIALKSILLGDYLIPYHAQL